MSSKLKKVSVVSDNISNILLLLSTAGTNCYLAFA